MILSGWKGVTVNNYDIISYLAFIFCQFILLSMGKITIRKFPKKPWDILFQIILLSLPKQRLVINSFSQKSSDMHTNNSNSLS